MTDVEPAAVHDVTIYKKSRPLLLAGLKGGGIENPVILADQGYKAPDIPELFVPAQPVSIVNGKRPIVENCFGRMAATFASVRHRYRFSIEHINLHVRALCYLTDYHVFLSPLRRDEYLFPVNWTCASQRGREEREKQRKRMETRRRTERYAREMSEVFGSSTLTPVPFQLSDLEHPTSRDRPQTTPMGKCMSAVYIKVAINEPPTIKHN